MIRRLYLLPLLLVALFFAFSTQTVDAAGTHTIRGGETLSGIAQYYGVSTESLASANGIWNYDYIYAGQVLAIPDAWGASSPAPATSSSGTWVVRQGDTLGTIAQANGTTIAALQQLNGIANPNYIFAGQVLSLGGNVGVGGGAAPVSSPVMSTNTGYKRIVVDLSEQRTYLYQGGQLINSFISSTGQPGAETLTGTFYIKTKLDSAYGGTWDIWMPWWLGIYDAGPLENGFHALPIQPDGSTLWAGYLGTPVSYGCIVLGHYDAQTLYQWAEYGTEVTIQY